MPRARFARLPSERRSALLVAAEGEFAEHGFAEASTARIAAAAGIGKATLYYWFEDKADLHAAVVERACAHIAARVGELAPADDAPAFWHAIEALMARANDVMQQEPRLAALGRSLYEAELPGRGAGALGPLLEATRAWFARVLDRGRKLGAVRADLPADLLVAAVTGMSLSLDRWFAEHWDELDAEAAARAAQGVVGLCRDLLEPRPAREAR